MKCGQLHDGVARRQSGAGSGAQAPREISICVSGVMPGVGSMLGVAKRVGASESTEALPGSGSKGTLFASASQPVAIGDPGGVLAMNAHTYEAQSMPWLGVPGPVTALVRGEP